MHDEPVRMRDKLWPVKDKSVYDPTFRLKLEKKIKDGIKIMPSRPKIMYNTKGFPTLGSIFDSTLFYYKASRKDILSCRRLRSLSHVRQVFYYLSRVFAENKFAAIGRFICKDHTTIMHGVCKIKKDLATDRKLRSDIEYIVSSIYADSICQIDRYWGA